MCKRTVVGGILLSGDKSLGVEEVLVGTSSDLVNDVGLKIDLDEKEARRGGKRWISRRPLGQTESK